MSRVPVPPPGLHLPGTSAPPLRGLLPDVARGLGADLPDLPGAGLPLTGVTRAVVLLVDGLGLEALRARIGHAPTLRRLIGEQPEGWLGTADAGYPSTTAASLTSFGTGLEPGRTGVLGYSVRDPRELPRPSGTPPLVNLVSWTAGEGVTAPDVRTWQPHPTVFERLEAQRIRTTSIGRARFAGSGLTIAALRGSRFVGCERLDTAVTAALEALRQPGLVYLYWGGLDHTAHRLGWSCTQWGEELGELDAALATLLRRAPVGTAVLVTADHGMVDVTERIDVASEPELRAGVALVAGEPRALHVHLTPGEGVEVAARRWTERLGELAWVLMGEEAVAGGLFGEVEERNRALIGDLVVATRGSAAIVDSRTQTPASLGLVGMHGSLTTAELAIPALLTRVER